MGIKHQETLVEHPRSNGQIEVANKVILEEVKKQVGKAKGSWAEELLAILWTYHCTPQLTIGETPFDSHMYQMSCYL